MQVRTYRLETFRPPLDDPLAFVSGGRYVCHAQGQLSGSDGQ
jgi:hypothetical protein